MTRRYTDPFRDVVSEEKGAGSDVVLMACGHRVVQNHRNAPRKRCRCHHVGCRVWSED